MFKEWFKSWGGPGSGHHGHKGVPGQRGGSVAGGYGNFSGFPTSDDLKNTDRREHPYGFDLDDFSDDDFEFERKSGEVLAKTIVGTLSSEAVAAAKKLEVDPREFIARLVFKWAIGNDVEEPASLFAFQKAIASELNVDGVLRHDRRVPITETNKYLARGDGAMNTLMKGIARAIYDDTQAKRGISKVSVVRGITAPLKGSGILRDTLSKYKKNRTVVKGDDKISIDMNPISSWAYDIEKARAFSGGFGLVLAGDVPATRVFSFGRNGFGDTCGEVVLLGGKDIDVNFYVDKYFDFVGLLIDDMANRFPKWNITTTSS